MIFNQFKICLICQVTPPIKSCQLNINFCEFKFPHVPNDIDADNASLDTELFHQQKREGNFPYRINKKSIHLIELTETSPLLAKRCYVTDLFS